MLDLHGKTEQGVGKRKKSVVYLFIFSSSSCVEMCNVENVIFAVEDVRAAFTRLCYSKNFELGRSAFASELPRLLGPLETWLGDRGSGWIAAPRITVADFFVYEVIVSDGFLVFFVC